MWMIVAPVPVASSTSTETSATAEKRGTTTLSAAHAALARRRANHSTSSPTRPPIQIEPEIRCSASNGDRQAARRGLAGVADAPGHDAAPRRPPTARPGAGGELGDRAARALGPVDPQRDPGGDAEQREAQLHVDVAAPERGHAEQRHQRAEVEHRAQRVLGDREVEVDGDRDQPDHASDHEAHRVRARRLVPGRPADRPAGRSASRSASSPIATITLRNIDPARDQQLRGDRGGGDVRDRELRRRARDWARSRR